MTENAKNLATEMDNWRDSAGGYEVMSQIKVDEYENKKNRR